MVGHIKSKLSKHTHDDPASNLEEDAVMAQQGLQSQYVQVDHVNKVFTFGTADNMSEEGSSGNVVINDKISDTSTNTHIPDEKPDKTSLAAVKSSILSAPSSKIMSSNSIDTRQPYRLGWPSLPAQPVHTTSDQVRQSLSLKSEHLHAMREILATHKITIPKELEVEVVHRHHPRKHIGKDTLTLVIPTDLVPTGKGDHEDARRVEDGNRSKLHSALQALRTYIHEHTLTFSIEFIHPAILRGPHTLPILAHDPLRGLANKSKRGVRQLLNECGKEWTSLDIYYRGYGPTRSECVATVVICVLEPDWEGWWSVDGIRARVKEKVKGRMDVEICWGEFSKG